jgi:hypothetical protein
MSDREILETFWQHNEAALNRLYSASGLDRELNAAKIERLQAQQDQIEWRLDRPKGPPLRWSGMP